MRGLLITIPALVLATLVAARPASADELKVGDRIAELDTAVDVGGKAFRLKPLKGWKMLTFGASWCKPCAKELPAWDKLAPKFKGKVTFVAVNIDNDSAKGKKFFSKLKVKNLMKVYLPADAASGDDAYATGTFPSTFVIDPQGILRIVHKGFASGDDGDLAKQLDELTGGDE
jgi:thiol-disulfide isomerase/thioredoxin